MRPENSRQYYLPPSLETPDQPAAAPRPTMTMIAPAGSKWERILHRATYVLVSLAAFVYICQALSGGLSGMFHRPAGFVVESPPTSETASAAKLPPAGPGAIPPTGPKGETIYGPALRAR